VERALRERGLLIDGATLDAQDGRVNVTLPAAAMQELVAALAALQERDAIRVLAATLTPRVDGGVRAELTLGR
jgi:type II secretory pathway component PulM